MEVKEKTQLAKTETPRDFMQKLLLPLEEEENQNVYYFDKTAIIPLPDRRLAKVILSTENLRSSGTTGNYRSILVQIKNKDTGLIDSQLFPFSTMLRYTYRIDDRDDFKAEGGFEVIDHVGWDWYIAIPQTTIPLCSAIARYIELFN